MSSRLFTPRGSLDTDERSWGSLDTTQRRNSISNPPKRQNSVKKLVRKLSNSIEHFIMGRKDKDRAGFVEYLELVENVVDNIMVFEGYYTHLLNSISRGIYPDGNTCAFVYKVEINFCYSLPDINKSVGAYYVDRVYSSL